MKKAILFFSATIVAAVAVAQAHSVRYSDNNQQEIVIDEMEQLIPHRLKQVEQDGMKRASGSTSQVSKQLDSLVTTYVLSSQVMKTVYNYDQWGNRNQSSNYNWDSGAGIWNITGKTVNVYNQNGKLTLQESYNSLANHSNIVCTSRTVTTWGEDNEGNLTSVQVNYSYDYTQQQLVNNFKQEAVFQGHTNVFKTLFTSSWLASESRWREYYKLFQLPQDDGFDQTNATYSLNQQTNIWSATKFGYSFNAEGKLIKKGTYSGWSETTQAWSNLSVENILSVIPNNTVQYVSANSTWQPTEKYEIEDGYTIKYSYLNGTFVKQTKELLENDAKGNEISYVRYDWDEAKSLWVLRVSRYYRYDVDGNKLFERKVDYSITGQETYHLQMSRTTATDPWKIGSTWERFSFYDQNDLRTYFYTTRYIDGAFQNYYKMTYTYDSQYDKVKEVRSDWNGSDWILYSNIDYYYSTLNNVLAVESQTVKQDGNGSFDLKFNIPTDATLQSAVFTVEFPQGFTIAPAATVLSNELATNFNLQLSYNPDGTININIVAKNQSSAYPKAPMAGKIQNIATIAFNVGNTIPIGSYTAKIHNSNVNFSNYQPLSQPLINVELSVTEVISGAAPVPQQSFSISPNPADNEFIVRGSKDKILHMYDLDGKHLLDVNLQSDEERIPLSGFDKGIYLLKLTDKGKLTGVEKLVVK